MFGVGIVLGVGNPGEGIALEVGTVLVEGIALEVGNPGEDIDLVGVGIAPVGESNVETMLDECSGLLFF